MTAEMLLSRLENVRQSGRGWRADCPCGHDSRGSLSITEGDDGRVLLHCFSGCAAEDVLSAVGLSLSDLYPERITHVTTEGDRKVLQRLAREGKWAAALGVLSREAQIVESAATRFKAENFTEIDYARLQMAFQRIHLATEVLLK
jgi:hypothetical protein